jgi:hypothetical protein
MFHVVLTLALVVIFVVCREILGDSIRRIITSVTGP